MAGEAGRLDGDLVDLQRELARRGDDERLDAAAAGDALERGQHERRGLAGAGLRAADDVAAFEERGMACSWMGVGSVYPIFRTPLSRRSSKPRLSKLKM